MRGAVFVAANATVLGDVTLDRGVNIWYGAVLRADEGALILGENSNVQDNAVLHCDPGGQVVLGKNVTVGHSAIVHGCTVGDNSLIGMHATILNHAVVGRNCIIGAGALVPEGMVIPDNSVAVGVPAQVIKTIRDDQLAHNIENAKSLCGDGPSARGAVRCYVVYYVESLVPLAFLCYHRVKTGRVPPARRYEECLRCFPAEYS